MDSSAGRKPDLSTANAGSEAGTNAEGANNLLHGEELQTLHAGQNSQQGLRQRCVSSGAVMTLTYHNMLQFPGMGSTKVEHAACCEPHVVYRLCM